MLIRFDWAMKRLLRQKANYTVLEGLLTVLLNEEVKIVSISESESNKASKTDKFNRVDILVENTLGELIIIEMQNNSEVDYFLRMLYAVSKTTVEHIEEGQEYSNLRKIYHVNIVYFKLGVGKDYVYRGVNEFRGIHHNDLLQLTGAQREFFEKETKRKNVKEIKDLFPEYCILCVADFDDVAKDSLDEWMYYMKNNEIPDKFTAPGLKEARKQLKYDRLSAAEKKDYDHHVEQSLYEKNAMFTSRWEGRYEGHEEGRVEGLVEGEAIGLEKGEAIGLEKGRSEEKENIVINSHHAGLPFETISSITGLTLDQITQILKKHQLLTLNHKHNETHIH